MTAYPDTSFLISLYTPDSNSGQAVAAMSRSQIDFLLSPFIEVELTNGILLRAFRREIEPGQAKAALAAFGQDVTSGVFRMTPLPAAIYDRAQRLARTHTATLGVRTLDVLHVASALVLGAETLYTFDVRQRKLATAVELRTAPVTK